MLLRVNYLVAMEEPPLVQRDFGEIFLSRILLIIKVLLVCILQVTTR